MGAVGEDEAQVLNPEVVHTAGVSQDELAAVVTRKQAAVQARAARYRVVRPREPLDGRVAVVVNDGIATGSTARTAWQIARAHGAARVVLAVPCRPARLPGGNRYRRHRPVLCQVPTALRRGGDRLPAARQRAAVVGAYQHTTRR